MLTLPLAAPPLQCKKKLTEAGAGEGGNAQHTEPRLQLRDVGAPLLSRLLYCFAGCVLLDSGHQKLFLALQQTRAIHWVIIHFVISLVIFLATKNPIPPPGFDGQGRCRADIRAPKQWRSGYPILGKKKLPQKMAQHVILDTSGHNFVKKMQKKRIRCEALEENF